MCKKTCILVCALLCSAGCQVVTLDYLNPRDTAATVPTDSASDSDSTDTSADTGTAADTALDTAPPDTGTIDDWGQLVQPVAGKCYDTEDGGVDGDGSGCYSRAIFWNCVAEYEDCMADSDCAANESCRLQCYHLTDDAAWADCVTQCLAAVAYPSRVKRERLDDCIYCRACSYDCRDYAYELGCWVNGDQRCSRYTRFCHIAGDDTETSCWECATGLYGVCEEHAWYCESDEACRTLENCVLDCNALMGEAKATCVDQCFENHPDGVALFDPLYRCVYCWAECKALCPADGPTCL